MATKKPSEARRRHSGKDDDVRQIRLVSEAIYKVDGTFATIETGCWLAQAKLSTQQRLNQTPGPSEILKQVVLCDFKELRRLAAVRGLVNSTVRRRAWPILLGISSVNDHALPNVLKGSAEGGSERAARDAQTIKMDVLRCLHQDFGPLSETNREAYRASLEQVLSAVVDSHHVYYFQGLHEIAATLLLQVGELCAYEMLKVLAVNHLRDFTRETLEAGMESLQIIFPILRRYDRKLARHLEDHRLPAFFALSWLITWFAHNVPLLVTPRLFDLFLASHPLMPLYLYAACMIQRVCAVPGPPVGNGYHGRLTYDVGQPRFLVPFGFFREHDICGSHDAKEYPPKRAVQACSPVPRRSCLWDASIVRSHWSVPEQPRVLPTLLGGVMSGLNSDNRRAGWIAVSSAALGLVSVAIPAVIWIASNQYRDSGI